MNTFLRSIDVRKHRRALNESALIAKAFIKSFNWLFPSRCIQCDCILTDMEEAFCDTCYIGLPFVENCCARCGQSMPGDFHCCGQCLNKPPNYDNCFCAFEYANPIDDLIVQCKYNQRPDLIERLALSFVTELKANEIPMPDILIPVPMHISRLRQRGFNQSLLLVKAISQRIGVPYSTSIVYKRKNTKPQAGLTLKQRQLNLNDSFEFHSKD